MLMAEDGPLALQDHHPSSFCLVPPREVTPPASSQPACTSRSRSGGLVAQSAVAPPGPIPNPVVTQRSAGEYCGGDPTGGEAAASPPDWLQILGCAESKSRKKTASFDAVFFYFGRILGLFGIQSDSPRCPFLRILTIYASPS